MVRVGQIRHAILVCPTRGFQELTPNEKNAEIHPWWEFQAEFYLDRLLLWVIVPAHTPCLAIDLNEKIFRMTILWELRQVYYSGRLCSVFLGEAR